LRLLYLAFEKRYRHKFDKNHATTNICIFVVAWFLPNLCWRRLSSAKYSSLWRMSTTFKRLPIVSTRKWANFLQYWSALRWSWPDYYMTKLRKSRGA